MAATPRYLRPTAEPAERAIVTGDPGRALAIAQDLISSPPPMFNHHRGLWGYSGECVLDGKPLVVQGAGLGAASHRAVIEDLIALGAARIVRIGSCASNGTRSTGEVVIVTEASAGTAGARLLPDPGLTADLSAALAGRASEGTVHSTDTPGRDPVASSDVTDLATASMLASASALGARGAAVLVVARDGETALDDAQLDATCRSLGAAAVAALPG